MASINELDKTKKMILFVGLPVLVIVFTVIIIVIVNMFGSGETEVSEYDPFSRLSLETVDAKPEEILDKSDGYRKHREDSLRSIVDTTIDLDKYAKQRIEDSIRKAEAKQNRDAIFAQFGLLDEDETDKAEANNSVPAFESQQKKEEPKQAVQKTAKKSSGGGNKSSKPKPKPAEPEDEGYGYYGFGAVGGSTTNTAKTATPAKPKKKLKENKYFEAFLIQNTTMKNQSQVTFILNQDVTLNGIRFKKMSRIFGVCTFGSNVVNIRTTTIQNTDGKKYPLELDAYNENYQKGIYVSGIEQVVNEGANDTQDDLIDEMNPNSALSVVNTGIKGAAKTVKKAAKREQQIQMSEGYKMYFPIVDEDDEDY